MKGYKSKILLIGALLLSVSALQAKTYKFATNIPSKDAEGVLLMELSDNIKKRTEGRVKFRFFWNGSLGNQAQYLQQVQSGVIDLGLANSATLENLAPEIAAINLPYVFRDLKEYEDTMLHPEVAKIIEDSVASKNVYMMGFLSNGFRSVYTTKPTSSLADLKGLKIRTVSSDTYVSLVRAMGAVPTPMGFGEVYSALQQGIIDGAEGGLAGLWDLKFGEVTKYALRTEHTRLTDFLIASEKFTTSVSSDDMVIVKEEFLNAAKKSFAAVAEQVRKSELLAASELGVQFTKIDKKPLIASMQPIYDKALANPIKKGLLETILRIQGR